MTNTFLRTAAARGVNSSLAKQVFSTSACGRHLEDFSSAIPRRNINNLRYADDTTLVAESEEELKSLFMKVKEESAKVSLKLNIQKTNIMDLVCPALPRAVWVGEEDFQPQPLFQLGMPCHLFALVIGERLAHA